MINCGRWRDPKRGDVKVMISKIQVDQILKVYKTNKSLGAQSAVEKVSYDNRQDEVGLSFTREDIEKIKELVKKMPDVREDLIAPISKKVETGEYSVESEAIAEKMMGRLLADKIR
ncbi:MAG TPA: flagellar biosynthesis anti-sigma factor FlgM [Bacillota bacterium]|jgi:flagellar biosynthesis anti-sigma factor FlgM|nr:flagellar biosynthesis anti-sigma factor FlgM [Bacillota bacterium]